MGFDSDKLEEIANEVRRTRKFLTGDVANNIENGEVFETVTSLALDSTFTDTEVDVAQANLVLIQTEANSSDINYKVVRQDGTSEDTRILLDLRWIVLGNNRTIKFTNTSARANLFLRIYKIQAPNLLLSALASQRDLEKWMQNLNQDAITTPYDQALPSAAGHLFNGTNFDRPRNNNEVTLLASASRTASTNSADFTLFNGKGLTIFWDISVVPGTDTVSASLQIKDPVSGTYRGILSFGAKDAVAFFLGQVYPGVTDVDTLLDAENDVLVSRTFRVRVIHNAGGAFEYSYAVSEAT